MITRIKHNDITWIDIKNPREKDIKYLEKKFHFVHKPVLNELIPPGHRAKVERHEDYLFMVLYYPIFDPRHKTTQSRELDVIITRDHIITVHYKAIIPLKKLREELGSDENKRKEHMESGPGMLLYHLVVGLLDSALNKLVLIEEGIDNIEEAIFEEGKEKEMVREISLIKRDILNFRRILAPQIPIMESLHREGTSFFGEFMSPYLDDLLGYYGRVWNAVEDQRETVQALGETNDSLLSMKTNEVIKVLTIFSVIVFPLTLISSIWGMNTEYTPFVDEFGSPFDFWLIIGLMAALSAFMLIFFKIKKWF